MEAPPNSWSWLTGALAGVLASILVTPVTTWLQENVRRNKEARSRALAQAIVFRNEIIRIARNKENLALNEIFDFVAQLAVLLNTPDIDRYSQNRMYAKLESISSKVWVDFFKTCPSEEDKQDIFDRLSNAVGGVGLNRNDSQLIKEVIYTKKIQRKTTEILKSLDDIITTLQKHPFKIRGRYLWNLFWFGHEGAYK